MMNRHLIAGEAVVVAVVAGLIVVLMECFGSGWVRE